MTADAAIEALRALHIETTYTVNSWPEGIPIAYPCCAVCDQSQGWPCQTRRILDAVEDKA